MPERKIPNYEELYSWLEEGKLPAWISGEYAKRGIEITPSAIVMARKRAKIPGSRIRGKSALVPWDIKVEHRGRHPLAMLRAELRVREGLSISEKQQRSLENWKTFLDENEAVVGYDPDRFPDEGFFYAQRREGIDLDLIREPKAPAATKSRTKTTTS